MLLCQVSRKLTKGKEKPEDCDLPLQSLRKSELCAGEARKVQMRKRMWLLSPAPKENYTYPAIEILSSASLVIASTVKQEAPT